MGEPAYLRLALFFIIIGWLIFVFDGSEAHLTLAHGMTYLSTMFGGGGAALMTSADVWDVCRSAVLLFIMVFASLPIGRKAVLDTEKCELRYE